MNTTKNNVKPDSYYQPNVKMMRTWLKENLTSQAEIGVGNALSKVSESSKEVHIWKNNTELYCKAKYKNFKNKSIKDATYSHIAYCSIKKVCFVCKTGLINASKFNTNTYDYTFYYIAEISLIAERVIMQPPEKYSFGWKKAVIKYYHGLKILHVSKTNLEVKNTLTSHLKKAISILKIYLEENPSSLNDKKVKDLFLETSTFLKIPTELNFLFRKLSIPIEKPLSVKNKRKIKTHFLEKVLECQNENYDTLPEKAVQEKLNEILTAHEKYLLL